jgi:hypothetical protein
LEVDFGYDFSFSGSEFSTTLHFYR